MIFSGMTKATGSRSIAAFGSSYIYGYPLFCNTKYDAWLACGHLFGVWAYARASMKFAPDGPH
jgi:hypothetical protein